MKPTRFPIRMPLGLALLLLPLLPLLAERTLPQPLQDWQDWATWDAEHRDCPTPYHDSARHLCFWPGQLSLDASPRSATWRVRVEVFSKTWVPLPGNEDTWPLDVRVNGTAVPVVEHAGQPCVELGTGSHQIEGKFQWAAEMPQQLRVPREVGVLALTLDGEPVEIPNWDESGQLWLKRVRLEATDKDKVSAQVWRVIEDGIPLWLRTEIELSVSGKSREEVVGNVVPDGWKIASVDAPIPVAVDDQGHMKAQVRAGKWTIRVDAFRTTDAGEIRFAPEARPVTATELVGFRALPPFRMAELDGLQVVDVSQTTFPRKWHSLPVYLWPTDSSFRLVEKMRGMGEQQPEGLKIARVFWLDEHGNGLTFRDQVNGSMQHIWRLDIAEGQELGAVKIGGQAQLITANPANGAPGVEIRARNLDLQALGRSDQVNSIPATGWRSSAEQLHVQMNLPPGWRLLALFGADWVEGDWLTAWTLLDLFLLLIFTLAVFKLWGWKAGLMAFFAFGLAYHEPGAPRLIWLLVLLPVALLRVVPFGGLRRWLQVSRYLAAGVLVLVLIPFLTLQIQGILYPQLEQQGWTYGSHPLFGSRTRHAQMQPPPTAQPVAEMAADTAGELPRAISLGESLAMGGRRAGVARFELTSNLRYESKARIQTGPAEPQWNWNAVRCGWNGPVDAGETIRPVFISLPVHRLLTILRIGLLLALAGLLLRARDRTTRTPPSPAGLSTVIAFLAILMMSSAPASAAMPDSDMIDTLRERLLEVPDAYPHAADIPSVDLRLTDGTLSMTAEIHTAIPVAVPLPGRLPSWSPVSVTVNGTKQSTLRREDGYLWVALPAGVHQVVVEGRLPQATEWAWTFQLRPRRVSVEAPGWTVTGIRPNGIPENQVFFARQREAAEGEADYDRRDFNAIVVVDRHLEIGLLWQLRTTITRMSSAGKAVSLRIPLLAGEKVLTAGVLVEDGYAEVRLAANETQFNWASELSTGTSLDLRAAETDRWVERWHLVTSPVWNVTLAGLPPGFEANDADLIPVWHPWPGETVTLTFSKPEAISGDTVTVRHVNHEIALGNRQRTGKLNLEVEASLGDDFVLELDPQTEVTTVTKDARPIPVRRDQARLIVPVHPGRQDLNIEWRSQQPLTSVAAAEPVTLPVEAANITLAMRVPESRWVLWTAGPLRGPAVRFWTVLAVAILAAWILSGLKLSPLGGVQWVLLGLGLTQTHLVAALIVVGWFFLVAWRGKKMGAEIAPWKFNLLQVSLVGSTVIVLGILVAAVSEGLLGNPEMFIRGNGSSRTYLQWFQPRSGTELPTAHVVSVSVWFYRILMLAWALWLAAALIRWLKWAWAQFSTHGCWKRLRKKPKTPPKTA